MIHIGSWVQASLLRKKNAPSAIANGRVKARIILLQNRGMGREKELKGVALELGIKI